MFCLAQKFASTKGMPLQGPPGDRVDQKYVQYIFNHMLELIYMLCRLVNKGGVDEGKSTPPGGLMDCPLGNNYITKMAVSRQIYHRKHFWLRHFKALGEIYNFWKTKIPWYIDHEPRRARTNLDIYITYIWLYIIYIAI